jgi:hypothetical protein
MTDIESTESTEPSDSAESAGEHRQDGSNAQPRADNPLAVDPTTEVSVPSGSETYGCPHCGRVFPRARQRDLHRGQDHPAALDDDEVDTYREAAQSEWDSLRRYRYVALGALVLLYFGFLIAFAVFG